MGVARVKVAVVVVVMMVVGNDLAATKGATWYSMYHQKYLTIEFNLGAR